MKTRKKPFVLGPFVVLTVLLSLAIALPAQMGSEKVDWTLRMNEARGPIRSADMSTLSGKTAVSEILGGPSSGSVNAYILYTRMPPGAHGPALYTLPVDDYYVVLSGKMTVQIGTDKFVVGPLTGVIIPANIPHEVWNAEAGQEANLEVITSGNPDKDLSLNLKSMLKPAQATKVNNAAQYIRQIKVLPPSDLKPGLNRQTFTNRAKGSMITVALDSTQEGSGGPKPHVHRFEQVYFMVEGETTISYGIDTMKAKKGDMVIIAPGVVHTNTNHSTGIERHITLLLPEPEKEPFDIEFEEKGAVGGSGKGAAPAR